MQRFMFRTLSLLMLLVLLAACSGGTVAPATVPVSTDTPVPLPTLTATSTVPLVILVVPTDLDPEVSNLYQKTVYDLAQASGMRYQVRNTLTAADLEPALKAVIALPPAPDISALAAAAPQAQFLAINMPGVQAGGNLSVLGSEDQVETPAFLAGYVAAMISDDYRIGMILPKDNPDAIRAFNAFANGMTYYCGLCRPFYPYATTSPAYIEIPSDESKDRYLGYANVLVNQKIFTLYVYPDLATPEFLTAIGTTGAQIIGTSMPVPRPAGWVMTIQSDIAKAIQNTWPNLVAGQGGAMVQSPLGLSDIDPALLTPGRQRLAQQTLDDLQAGRIGVNP